MIALFEIILSRLSSIEIRLMPKKVVTKSAFEPGTQALYRFLYKIMNRLVILIIILLTTNLNENSKFDGYSARSIFNLVRLNINS